MKKTFDQLSEEKKKQILELIITRFTYKGLQDPEFKAKKFLTLKEPKTRKGWHFMIWISKLSIDRRREKLGLCRLYSTKEDEEKMFTTPTTTSQELTTASIKTIKQ